MKDYFKIGKLAASFGLKGELVLAHNFGKKTALKGLETIFIEETKGSVLPYFITAAKAKNDHEVFICLDGIDTVEAARKLTPKEVWVVEADFKKFAANQSPIALLGFMMLDEEANEMGKIIEVIEQPHQILCAIMLGENEALIPVHQDNLVGVDHKKQTVTVIIPDGLLDIYS